MTRGPECERRHHVSREAAKEWSPRRKPWGAVALLSSSEGAKAAAHHRCGDPGKPDAHSRHLACPEEIYSPMWSPSLRSKPREQIIAKAKAVQAKLGRVDLNPCGSRFCP